MKLLIITQVVDSNHPVLGFFHRWVEEFADHAEQVHVICLQEGDHHLPQNVTVHSLGKEKGSNKLTYLLRFYSLIWKFRHEYDAVFVHMNQEYILLGGFFWKIFGKKVALWRNHFAGSFLTQLAGRICNRVYYTSTASYTARFKNAIQMPIGLNADIFKPVPTQRKKGSLLYVGRISSSKRIKALLEALKEVRATRQDLTLTIVGPTLQGEAEQYLEMLKTYTQEHSLPVTFFGSVPWEQLPTVYSAHELCINLSPPGMFDKVIGEALLCGCDVVTTNYDAKDLLHDRVLETDFAEQLTTYLRTFQYNQSDVEMIAKKMLDRHSLRTLVTQVIAHTQG
jgi:glycosyltransferase involved in cell wall biosynthesis